MKRLAALALSLVMLLALTAPALAAEGTPTPPAWVKAEEYLTFPGDAVYQKENWERILRLRADAAAGHLEPQKGDTLYESWSAGETYATATPGLRFELGLIGMKYGENAQGHRATRQAGTYFSNAKSMVLDATGSYNDPAYLLMELWYLRARLLSSDSFSAARELKDFLAGGPYTMEDFKAYPGMSAVTEEEWAKLDAVQTSAEQGVVPKVWLDGYSIGTATVKNGVAMMPVRHLAELLGSEIGFDAGENAVRLQRAGREILLPVGKTTATVNGQSVTLAAAPYVENGLTYFPVSQVTLLDQRVEWVPMYHCYSIMEDKSLAGDTNLEKWALPMGAVLNYIRTGGPMRFGGRARYTQVGAEGTGMKSRHENLQKWNAVYAYEEARFVLANSWGIDGREDLIETVYSMTYHGHNDSFLGDVAMIDGLSAAQYRDILKNAQGMDKYMFPYTKQLGEKWGDKGILCWDLFRMSNLVQWGYEAGYVTYAEALALLEPASKALHDTFGDWDEAYENYLDGYFWWAREDVLNKDPRSVGRGLVVSAMLRTYQNRLMDDGLFKTPVKGVPGLTAEQLLQSVS